MRSTRRLFLKSGLQIGTAATAHAMFPLGNLDFPAPPILSPNSPDRSSQLLGPDTGFELVDPAQMRALALRAVDAARSAGADYVDVRLTRIIGPREGTLLHYLEENLAVGVRACVRGGWGFAASPYWTLDEMPVLAQTAVAQAKASASIRPADAFVASPPATGQWTMPLEIDPFTVSIEEQRDYLAALNQYCLDTTAGIGSLDGDVRTTRREQMLVSSEGTDCHQTLWRTVANFGLKINWQSKIITVPFRHLQPAGRGWELLRDARLLEQVPRLFEEGLRLLSLPVRPFDIGRYDVALDALAMATVIGQTIGAATELDRALGDEANISGTSYLGPNPGALLGTYQAASPVVDISANRALPGGLATVKWDDEGVAPNTASLVTEGLLTDYQTTRSNAATLAPWYEQRKQPLRSHGYAASDGALSVVVPHRANLALHPANDTTTMTDLVSGIQRGLAVYGGRIQMDYQKKNGFLYPGLVREVSDGKLGAALGGTGVIMFNTTELLKSITAIGGTGSSVMADMNASKGDPSQSAGFTVQAVPASIKNVSFVDGNRR